MCLRTHKPHYTMASVALYRTWVRGSRFPPSRGVTVHRDPFKSVCAGHAALNSIGTGLILTLSHSLPGYSLTLAACLFSHSRCLSILRLIAYLDSGSLPMYSQAHCLSSLRLTAYVFSGSLPMYSQAHCLCILRLTACLVSGSLPI